ncbi:MAG: hypothetical protein K2F70_08045 [Muribaculaceae bacterium]|nr:hypothetical protein [Muribaculaceae bacterium]
MEQPYRANALVVKSVGMLPGASAENISLSMNVQHIKTGLHHLTQPRRSSKSKKITHNIPGSAVLLSQKIWCYRRRRTV